MGLETFDEFQAWMDKSSITDEQRVRLVAALADAVDSLHNVRQDVVRRAIEHEPHPEVTPGQTYADYIGQELRDEVATIVTAEQLEAFDDVFPLPVVLAAAEIAVRGE